MKTEDTSCPVVSYKPAIISFPVPGNRVFASFDRELLERYILVAQQLCPGLQTTPTRIRYMHPAGSGADYHIEPAISNSEPGKLD